MINADDKVKEACEKAIIKLSKAEIEIVEKEIFEIEEMHNLLAENNGGTTVAEAYSK